MLFQPVLAYWAILPALGRQLETPRESVTGFPFKEIAMLNLSYYRTTCI